MIKDKEIRLALKITLIIVATLIVLWIIIKLAPVISLLVIALFIVYCINPMVKFLTSIKIKPLVAAIVSSLFILLVVLFFFYLLVPGLIMEMRQLIIFLTSELIPEIPELISTLSELDDRFNLQLTTIFVEYTNQFVRQAPDNIQSLLRHLSAISMGIFSRTWVLLALVFLVFYLVQDLDRARYNLTLLFPKMYKIRLAHILSTIDEKVGAYIRGTLMKCLFVALLTFIGLSLLDMPFALMLGLMAGLFNIILYIGPVVATVPAVLLSIMPDTPSILLVLLLYIVVQVLDAFLFTPLFLGKATDLRPLTVIVVVLIGGQLLGVLGIIIAIPIAATLKVLLFHYYLDKRNDEDIKSSAKKLT